MGQVCAFWICKVLRLKWSEISGLTPGRDDIFWILFGKLSCFECLSHCHCCTKYCTCLPMKPIWALKYAANKQVCTVGWRWKQFGKLANVGCWFLVRANSGSLWFWFQFLRQWDPWETVCSGHFPPHWLEWCQKLRLWRLESRQMDLQWEEICNNIEFNSCWLIGHVWTVVGCTLHLKPRTKHLVDLRSSMPCTGAYRFSSGNCGNVWWAIIREDEVND